MNKRVLSIDIVRGLVMIIMALDHTRDLLHFSALTQNPTNLATTTPAIFLSRWITHLCAPTFVFLSGVSVYLVARRSNPQDQRNFLLKRGLWLILLEFTFINFILWFDVQFRIIILQVIAAIGVGLIILSLLSKVSPRVIGIIALVIIFTHNLLQLVPPTDNPTLGILRNLFFTPGLRPVTPGFMFLFAYPLVPWVSIMLLGYSFGRIFEKEEASRNKNLALLGFGALLLFLILRYINVYGDPAPWREQKDTLFTILSFFNVTKQAPSLLFILLFIGIALVLLRYAGILPKKLQEILAVYGRVPLFYYLIHWCVIRLAMFIMVFAQGYKWDELSFAPFQFGRAPGSGIGLAGTAAVWLLIVLLLYPLCKWYSKYKMEHPEKKWLRYL